MAAFYVNSAYTDEELANLNAASTVAYRSLAKAQQEIAEGDSIELVITEDCEIKDWSKVASVTIKNGAVLTTNNWDSSKTSLSIDLTGVTTKAANAGASVIYTGSEESVNWGVVTVTGSETAGGWQEGNNIFAGTQVFYNDASLFGSGTVEKDVIVMDGATFSRGEGKTFAVTDYKYSSTHGTDKLLIDPAPTNYATLATSNPNAKVVYMGSQYLPDYIYMQLAGNAVFYDAYLANGTYYSVWAGNLKGGSSYHLFTTDTGDEHRTVSFVNTAVKSTLSISYGASGSGRWTVNVIGSTLSNLASNRGGYKFEGDLYVNVSGSTLASMNGSPSGSMNAGGFYYTYSNNSVVSGDVVVGGYVSEAENAINGEIYIKVESGSKVNGTIKGIASAANYTAKKGVKIEISGGSATEIRGADNVAGGFTGKITGNVDIVVRDSQVNNIYATGLSTGAGAAVSGGVYVKLEGNATIVSELAAFHDTAVLGRHLQISGENNIITAEGNISTFNTLKLADGAQLTLTQAGIALSAQEGINSVITIGQNARLNVATTISGFESITIDTTDVIGGVRKAVDAAASQTYGDGQITLTAEGTTYTVCNGDIIVHSSGNMDEVFVVSEGEYATGEEIASGVYYGINTASSIDAAQAKLSESGSITLIISEDVTINDWTGVSKVIIKNGATVTTDNWNSDIELTIDLTGVDTLGYLTTPSIVYTGDAEQISYGNVAIVGPATAGGWVSGNDLYVGNGVVYNHAGNEEVTNPDSVTIRGTTFTKADGSKFTVYNYWAGGGYSSAEGALVEKPADQAGVDKQPGAIHKNLWHTLSSKNPNAMVVCTGGSGDKKYTGNYSNANLYGNVIFIDAVFTKDTYYNDKVWSWSSNQVKSAGASNYVTLLKGIKENSKTTFDGFVDPGLQLVIFYNTTSSTIQQVSLDLINSHVGNIQYVRSGANYTGTLSINLEDSIVGNLSGMSSGIPTLGIIDVNLSGSTVTGNISGGNGNSSSEGDKKVNAVDIDITDGSYAGTVYGGHIINSSKGGFILNGAAGIDTVSICVEDSTVNTIYASHFITNANSAKQTSTVAGNVSISLKNAKVTNIYAVGGAAITGNVTTTVENSNILGFISATGCLTGYVSGSVTGDISLDVIGTNRVAGNVDGFEFVNLSANSALTVGGDFTLAENGKIVIDAANYQGGYHFVLNVTGSSNVTAENIEFVNGTLDKVVTDSGDIYVYDSNASKTIYVDASLSGLEEGIVTLADGTNVFVGKNAFATLDEALTAVADGGVIILNGNHTVKALDNDKVSEYIINGKVIAGNVSCDNITINAASGMLIADTLNADVRLDIKSISDANLNNCVLHVKGTHTGNIVPANNGVFESYSDGKSVFVTGRQNDDIYINKNWTKQADVDAAGIDAVWNVNAFSTLTPTQTGRINSDKTIHLLGSGSDEFVNPNNLPLYGADLVVEGGKWIFKLFGGGVGADSYGDSNITVKDNGLRDKAARDEFQTNYASDANKKDPFNLVRVYGGNGQGGRYYGDTVLNVSNSGYKMIVGGGMGMDEFYGDITIVADNVYAENFVGGSQENGARGKIYGDISVTVTDSEIGSFIGANSSNGEGGFKHSAFVTGSVDVTVSNTTFASTVYAGSRADSKNGLQGNKDSYVKAITLNMSNSNITSGSLYITGHNHVQTDVSASLSNVTVKDNIFLGAMEYVGGKYIVSGNASLSLNGVSVGSNIYGDQFDNITGIASLALSGTNNVSGSVSGFDTITINVGATLVADAVTVGNINVALAADGAEELLIIDTNSGITVTGNISGDNEYDVYVFNGDLWASKKLAAVAVGYDDADSDGFVTINGKQVKLFNTVADANNALRFGGSLYIGSSLNGGTNKIENVEVENNVFGAGNAETPTSVDLSISGATTQAVLGGGSSSGSKVGTDSAEGFVGGTIKLTLTDSNVGTVYGGGYSSVVGDIALSIKDSICKNIVYGGNVTNTGSLTADTESTIGDVALTINGGEFNNKVVGGSRVVASENSPANVTTKVGNVTLNIDGGHFADTIFGAGYILGNKNGTGNESNAQLKVAGVTMTLNDMTITNTNTLHGIYAGGLAARGANISVGTVQTRSAGSSAVNITINSGKYTSIYGGGWAESGATVTVYGVSINVTGGEIANLYGGGNNDQSGARTYVDGDVLITISGGTIGNVCAGAKFVTSKVKGSSTIQITGNATIGNLCGLSNNNYDGVLYDQTLDVNAELKCNSISGFDVIDIASGASVTLVDSNDETTLSFDFAGVDLVLGDYNGDTDWIVMTAEQLTNLAEASSVMFGDKSASLNEAGGYWATETHSLKVTEDNKLIFGKLA